MNGIRLSRLDWVAAGLLWVATFAIFAPGAPNLGFYYDDNGWIHHLQSAGWPSLRQATKTFVPGRPLFVVGQYLLFRLVGDPVANLTTLHLIQSALDALVVAAFFVLLRLLIVPPVVALPAAGLFAFWPIHGQTHFWITATSQHLISTLLAITFLITSLLLARDRGRPWLWIIDAGAFLGSLLLYDQGFFALLGLVILRAGIPLWRRSEQGRALALAQLPYLSAGALILWWKQHGVPAQSLEARPALASLLTANILSTGSATFGRGWLTAVAPLFEKVTPADWALALLVAGAVTGMALRLSARQPEASASRSGFLVAAAFLFYLAAYLPVWLWHLAQRHHYLPSLGLFAGGAACLAWIMERTSSRAARLGLVLALGGATAALAAACRGESRYWEEAFQLKKQLFAELAPDLAGKDALALEDFPDAYGPAFFLTPHDAEHAARLLHRSVPWSPRLRGDIGWTPVPGGLFLYTYTHYYNRASFRYSPASSALVARFSSIEDGRLRFEKNPPRTSHYRIVASTAAPAHGAFRVDHLAARRDGDDIIVSLKLQADMPPRAYLTATLSYWEGGGFHPWGRFDRRGGLIVLPLLFSDPGPDPPAGGRAFDQTLRVHLFPGAPRLRLEFFQADRERVPSRLGQAEAPIEP